METRTDQQIKRKGNDIVKLVIINIEIRWKEESHVVILLNMNGLNSPTKSQRLLG